MTNKEFDKIFDAYLDSEACDKVEDQAVQEIKNALFTVIQGAFEGGWKAAGGELPQKEE